jgi:hypothetical protein
MITKTLTVNTVHLSAETLEMLADEAVMNEAGSASNKSFPFMHVCIFGHPNVSGPKYLIDIDREKLKEILARNNDLPTDLRRLLLEAFVEWCDTIRLHDDAPVYAALAKYK